MLLVRHPPVAKAWAGRCYGRSDMGWSRDGTKMARALAPQLAARPLAAIVHSGAIRTRRLAEMVGAIAALPVRCDPRWLERDFGIWEGRGWNAIWRETGDMMNRMMTDPESFRPGGGETGRELSDRVKAGWDDLDVGGDILVVAHGGSMAAIRTSLAREPIERMIDYVPGHGAVIVANRSGDQRPCQQPR